MSDNSEFWLVIIGVFDILMTIALFYVGSKARKIDTLEADLKKSAKEIIDAKFEILNEKFKAPLAQMTESVQVVQKRLDRGDTHFDTLGEVGHRLELRLEAKIADARDWARENFATCEDLKTVENSLQRLQVTMAAFHSSTSKVG